MAGHSKFKNIQHRKNAQDKKRAKIFTKALREITTAVRTAGVDLEINSRLRTALIFAKSVNLPKDKIDKAINSGSSDEKDNYEEMTYEGFLPGGVGIIVEALTDNRNRTLSDVRSTFTKFGGLLGKPGSVSFTFERVGVIEFFEEKKDLFDKITEIAIDAGAKDVDVNEENCTIYTEVENFHEVINKISADCADPDNSELSWIPNNKVLVSDKEKAEKLIKMLNILEDHDDVQNIYAAYELTEDLEYLIDQ